MLYVSAAAEQGFGRLLRLLGFFFAVNLRGKGVCKHLLGLVYVGRGCGEGIYFVYGHKGEHLEAVLHAVIVHIAPVLIEFVRAGLCAGQATVAPFSVLPIFLPSLVASRPVVSANAAAIFAPYKVGAAEDVAPLVVAAHFQHAAVFLGANAKS